MNKEKEDVLQNFTIVTYRKTRDRYFDLKEKEKLTHDELFNKLLDKYEEDNHAIKY